MARNRTQILVVDDDQGHRSTLATLLSDWGHRVTAVVDGESAVDACKNSPFDLVLMDVRMTGISGIDALKAIRVHNPAIPIIIMTAYSDVSNAVEALKAGAYDYLTKPLDFDELKLTLERAAEHLKLIDENSALKKTLDQTFSSGEVIGQSPQMHAVFEMVSTIATSEATVLITGESGTGKEVVAKMIHANSNRKNGPYIAVNCAALTETLLESELFGHERGAFTGAEKKREGRFWAANNGTIFLDEIGEIPLAMQAKLLRVIQEREIQRVGGDHVLKVDVRILAATNKILKEEVAAGRFRQDLFYRLNVVSLRLPALRERREDIPPLAMHFLKKFAKKNEKNVKGFTPGAMDILVKYAWPGNVRELENTVERAVVLLMGEYASERELPPALFDQAEEEIVPARDFSDMTLEEIERVILTKVVENVGGNKSEAARRLGITRKTLALKMQRS
ncbi:sigma-54-dependent transcriptional regulator [Desulfovibrio sp.]|uniref:sigma-54-dependent transcriptional regulator n=1 Tax=Desulfovibrio sp. TaxID=885 RepID=UPI003D0A4C9E